VFFYRDFVLFSVACFQQVIAEGQFLEAPIILISIGMVPWMWWTKLLQKEVKEYNPSVTHKKDIPKQPKNLKFKFRGQAFKKKKKGKKFFFF